MLIGQNELTNERYFPAFENTLPEVESNKKNLICPDCKKKIILVNGLRIITHFRHKVKANCNPEPETVEHLNMKKYFVEKLNLTKENVEVNLGFAKPDIYMPKQRIAIEVQHSAISESKFLERTKKYTENNIYVLWVFDYCLFKESVPAFLRKAHELYFGRVYFFVEDKVVPVHFNPLKISVPEYHKSIYIEDFEEYKNNGFEPYYETFGGYEKFSKTKREPILTEPIEIISDIRLTRNTWKGNNFLVAKFNDEVFWK